jgi:hypothetical protein
MGLCPKDNQKNIERNILIGDGPEDVKSVIRNFLKFRKKGYNDECKI